MRDETFANLSLNKPPRHAQPHSAEPELGFSGEPWLEPRISVASPADVTPGSRSTATGEGRFGGLLYLVLIGLVAAATVGVFFGAGFSLLAPPVSDTSAGAGAPDGKRARISVDALRTDRQAPPTPREIVVPQSAEVAALPAVPLAQRTAAAETSPAEHNNAAERSPPAPASGDPSARTGPEAVSASRSPASPAPAIPSVSRPPSSTQDALLAGGDKRRPKHDGRNDSYRAASGHSHWRSARSTHPLSPSQYRSAQRIAPSRTVEAQSFDQLLTQLNSNAKPAVQSLTPPPASKPDPFSQPVGK
jgi:hypothetical protein